MKRQDDFVGVAKCTDVFQQLLAVQDGCRVPVRAPFFKDNVKLARRACVPPTQVVTFMTMTTNFGANVPSLFLLIALVYFVVLQFHTFVLTCLIVQTGTKLNDEIKSGLGSTLDGRFFFLPF